MTLTEEQTAAVQEATHEFLRVCAEWAGQLIAEGTQLGKVGTPEAPDNLRLLALTAVDFPERQRDVWRAGLELMAKTCEITRDKAEEAPYDL